MMYHTEKMATMEPHDLTKGINVSVAKQLEENAKRLKEHYQRVQSQHKEIENQKQEITSFVCDWQ
jgi:myo-inositol-1-phosphate synthase